MKKLILILLVTFITNSVMAQKITYSKSLNYLIQNIQPAGTAKGTIVASPSKANPDYWFHWVRDAALVMSAIIDVAQRTNDYQTKKYLYSLVDNYIYRVKENQKAAGFWGLGEPKYNVDGTVYTGPWGRPQHDGPALRALTLIKYANILIASGQKDYVIKNLYSPTLPATSPIKMDLEYTARHWNQQGFDYWEEVMGLHFSTAMAQRKALIEGAKLATLLGDVYAAGYYKIEVKKIEVLIAKFWDNNKGYIQSTLYQTRGVGKSQLDISSILGIIHAETNDGFYPVDHPHVLKTVLRLEDTFKGLYKINAYESNQLGLAIGRYPEDTYNGYNTDGVGHAWFLATFAMAELHLKLAHQIKKNFRITNTDFYCRLLKYNDCNLLSRNLSKANIISALYNKALGYFNRANYHAASDGRMSEQMNRYSGYMEGANNLTWSYASHLTALLQYR